MALPPGASRSLVAVAGEALVDLVPTGPRAYRAVPGGSPANVAVALARLEVPVSFVARLGRGSFGGIVREHLRENGIDLRHAVETEEPTTLAVLSLDEAGSASYEFYGEGTADWGWRREELPASLGPDVVALHTGSLALALPPGGRELEALMERERARGVTISLDPNLRPGLMGDADGQRRRVERELRLAHVVRASEEDVTWLYPGSGLREVARHWRSLGPRLVIVTRGADGILATGSAALELERPARPAQVVDTVGAGDAFCAGLLEAMYRRELLGNADALASADADLIGPLLERASLVAALTCERAGADPPRREAADAAARGLVP